MDDYNLKDLTGSGVQESVNIRFQRALYALIRQYDEDGLQIGQLIGCLEIAKCSYLERLFRTTDPETEL